MLLLAAVVAFVVVMTAMLAWAVSHVVGGSSSRTVSQAHAFVIHAKQMAEQEKIETDSKALFEIAKRLATPIGSTLPPVAVPHPILSGTSVPNS